MTIYEKLLTIKEKNGAGYFVLLDPGKFSIKEVVESIKLYEESGVDALLIGGSILFTADFDEMVKSVKQNVAIPVILFPGSGSQLSRYADAVLFMSLISGRNPHYLIDEQVLSAPIVHELKLEPISTGYLLIESGKMTAVEFMSSTKPLPRDKPEITVAHALAAQYLGMKMIYLEGGSGAKLSVPEEIIRAVSQIVSIPIIVGGGIRTAEVARKKVEAGASFIVTGNILEEKKEASVVKSFVQAVHTRER